MSWVSEGSQTAAGLRQARPGVRLQKGLKLALSRELGLVAA